MRWIYPLFGLMAFGYLEAQTVSFTGTYDMNNAVPPNVSVESFVAVDTLPGGYIAAGVFAEVISLTPLTVDTASVLLTTDVGGSVLPGATYRIGGAFVMDVKYHSGGYLASGFTVGSDTSGLLFLLDPSSSSILWGKRLSINQSNSSPDVRDKLVEGIALPSGGFVFVGESADDFGSGFDAIVLKTDNSGNLQWYHFLGGTSPYGDKARDVKITPSEDVVVTGIAGGFFGNYSGFVALFDPSGALLWGKVYGSTDNEYLFEVQPTSDGGFVAVGDHMVGSDTNVLVLKLDASGNVEWAMSYGDAGRKELGRGVVEVGDGYVISGSVGGDVLLFKIDHSGNVVWARNYGGPGVDVGSEVTLGHGGGFAVVGVWGVGMTQDGILIKTLNDGRVLSTGGGSCTYQGDVTLTATPLTLNTTALPTLARSLTLVSHTLSISPTQVSQNAVCPLGFEDPLGYAERPQPLREGLPKAYYRIDGRRTFQSKGILIEKVGGKCRRVIRK